MNLDKLREMVRDRGVWPAAVHGVPTSQMQLSQQSMYVYIHILIYTHTCIIQKNQEKERRENFVICVLHSNKSEQYHAIQSRTLFSGQGTKDQGH